MNDNTVLMFTSKDCKNEVHSKCGSKWTGLGFNIICGCICHEQKPVVSKKQEEMELERQFVEPYSNTNSVSEISTAAGTTE
jgi:hypothetical protein